MNVMIVGGKTSQAQGEAQQVLGYDHSGGTGGSTGSDVRCVQDTTVGAMTVTHGWWYTVSTTVTAHSFWMSIWTDDSGPDTLVGQCSTEGTIPGSGAGIGWNEVTFSPGISLDAATTYWICFYTNASDNYMYYYSTTGTNYYDSSESDCTTGQAATSSTKQNTIEAANYDYR
jgi:hypothetical protein